MIRPSYDTDLTNYQWQILEPLIPPAKTGSWFGHYRRLSKDHEFLPTTSEMMIFASMIHIFDAL